jgi:hypothetical protein
MTLLEVMIAATIFVSSAMGLAQVFIQSYRMAALTRYQDASKNILDGFSAQFQRLQYLVTDPATPNNPVERPLFTITTGETGVGLIYEGIEGTQADGLPVTLQSGTGNSINAVVHREVYDINETTGVKDITANSIVADAAGRLLAGRFIIRFTYRNKEYFQQISTLRNIQ